ncbi:hypothetical protein [Pedobacter duraquae]|uniref:Uncharacterized protein n=1 Tax=Pedobacter duraquae TaxID=425511 RepID=A0A4R6II92_9SPHI|nr:hypothetical protein [Pedobacter duraquae]TDO21679.1 hypothetical protein CLV32_2786 [Pedobacter duraquae]
MLIKLTPLFSTYARHREEKAATALTRQQWIKADRIVMIVLLICTITTAILLS